MTSSMLSGEKRWASQRRSGMTVLGKVAVPKPINLPSQRLENHGLDPNVEIVPKGTLSWGSKSSSSPNAWGSSTLSPKADGGGGSPSHLSARPSSGGSGTRPSTAGSDRAHEPVNAWGPSSRPSSASGAITSNQTSSASLRPRSADTRPGSSQLSRFAESVSESSGAWSATGTAEKLGIASSKNEGFSLTSGDFPTLGSEKDTTGKNAEPQDHRAHSRPGSSSSEIAAVKERIGDVAVGINARSGTADSWRRDSPTCPEDGVRPGVEKWHADPHGPHPFPNAGMPPQHYDAWHAPPVNNHPGGVWYNRGPPGGLPYRSPVPPGGFPMEPIHYYGPQVPGPQPVPPPGAGPRGHPSNNGAMFRPPMADAYVRPGMPMRPGFYPPPVPYEGFYGPPMGYCNTNERDIQFMGMAAGPAPYNRFPAPNAPDMGSAHPRASGYGHSGKALAPEHVESGHPHETRGPYKVLLKQHDGWDNKEEQKWKDKAPTSVDKDGRWEGSSWENDTKTVYKGEEMNLQRTVGEEAPHSIDERRGVSVSMKVKLPESAETAKAYDSASKGMEHPASSSEVSMASKDSSLIQKIEDLNVKARVSGGRHDPHYVSNREEQKNKIHVDAKANHSRNEGAIGSGAVYPERSRGVNSVSDKADRSHDSVAATGAVISRRSTHGVLSRNDHRSKGRFDSQEIDALQKKPAVLDASSAKPAGDLEISNLVVRDHSTGSAEKSVLSQARDEGEPAKPIYDPSDNDTQRARMRELAQQRVKQRQKEEEEREREQKAKALAKLEELNRRTQGLEISAQKMGADSASAVLSKQEEPRTLEVVNMPPGKSEASGSAVVSDSNVVSHIGQSVSGVQKVTVLSDEPPSESTKTATKESSEKDSQSLSLQEGVNNADPRPHNNFTQAMDVNAPKQKRVSYRQKHNAPSEKSSAEKFVSTGATELQKHPTDAAPNAVSSAEVVANEPVSNTELNSAQNIMKESLMPQRRKNGRNSRNKQKVEETSSEAALPSGSEKESRITSNADEGDKPKSSDSERAPRSVHSLGDSQSSEKESLLPTEEFHGRANNQWKSQHSRKPARNPQSHKPVEKFHNNDVAVVWAPVRSHNRSEATEEVNQQKTEVEAGASSAKSDPQLQNTQRNKRAELERYVPKPAAKEISQHGNIQQPVAPSENQPSVDDTFRRGDRRSHGPAAVTEPWGGDSKQNRQGRKGYGSWNQHASTEPTSQGMLDGQSSNSSKMTYKSTEHQEYQKIDTNIVKEQPKNDEWDDGWFMPEPLDSAVQPTVPVIKDQREATRGKRHTMKGHRGGVGNNHEFDHRKTTSGEVEKHHTSQPPVAISVPTDLPATSKESRAVGDRSSSHWQPKSSSRPENGQNVGSENGRGNRRDSNSRGRVPYNEGMDQPPQDLPLSRKGNVEERRPGSAKGRPYSPNMELPMEIRPEQRMPRRNGNQNNRYGRGQQESHGEWNSSGQERHPPANRDRQRYTPHYEYQPVGPQHNNTRPNNPEGPKDGSHNAGPRFRERGQGQGPSRRGGGNFHGRQSSNSVRVDDGGHD